MLAANSLRAESSKNRRGLVLDSVRTDSGRSRYSVLAFAIVIRCSLLGSGFQLVEQVGSERTGLITLSARGQSGSKRPKPLPPWLLLRCGCGGCASVRGPCRRLWLGSPSQRSALGSLPGKAPPRQRESLR